MPGNIHTSTDYCNVNQSKHSTAAYASRLTTTAIDILVPLYLFPDMDINFFIFVFLLQSAYMAIQKISNLSTFQQNRIPVKAKINSKTVKNKSTQNSTSQ